jgi:hypothetical protein
MRSLLRPSTDPDRYYGDPALWDLIYMGHCGDYLNSLEDGVGVGHHGPQDLTGLPYIAYKDVWLPDRTELHPFTASFLTALEIPEKTRVIHSSRFPLCTFAYAVTRASAARLVDELASPKTGQVSEKSAFDIIILEACRDKHFQCWTVNPELFHHMDRNSIRESGGASTAPMDVSGREQVMKRNESSNIGCGFYSKDFQFGDDHEKLNFLREEVGRKGRCLKPGRLG